MDGSRRAMSALIAALTLAGGAALTSAPASAGPARHQGRTPAATGGLMHYDATGKPVIGNHLVLSRGAAVTPTPPQPAGTSPSARMRPAVVATTTTESLNPTGPQPAGTTVWQTATVRPVVPGTMVFCDDPSCGTSLSVTDSPPDGVYTSGVSTPTAGTLTLWAKFVPADSSAAQGSASAQVSYTFIDPTLATGTYHANAPVRLLDTRKGTAANPISTQVGALQTITVQVAGGAGTPVPGGASAAVLNVTATNVHAVGFVSVAQAYTPSSSTLNVAVGQTVPNLVASRLAPDGTVSIYNGSTGPLDLIADLEGYYTPDMAASTYHASAPVRLLDTRWGTTVNPVRSALGSRQSMAVRVTGAGTPVPAGASAVALNVTATNIRAVGFLSVAPASSPGTSNLNLVAGQTLPNLVISQLAQDGTVTVYNGSTGPVDVIADLQGYDTPDTTGSAFTPLPPQRVLNTVGLTSVMSQIHGPVGAHQTLTVPITGSMSPVPAGVRAVALNVTATNVTTTGFLSVAPQSSPGTSNLNVVAGQTVPNMVVSQLASDGSVAIYNGTGGPVDVIADVEGYFG